MINFDWVQHWQESRPLKDDDAIDLYFRSRGIALGDFPKSLRYSPRTPIGGDADLKMPAMLALVQDGSGKTVGLHVTYLARGEIGVADIPSPRRLVQGNLPVGSAVRLGFPMKTLGVAEGIEAALAARVIFRIPVWATLNTATLEHWEPPPGVEEVAVFADADADFRGQMVAFSLAHRMRCKGLRATVNVPPVIGEDMVDVLLHLPERGIFAGCYPEAAA